LQAAGDVYDWLELRSLPHTRAAQTPSPYEGYWWQNENGVDVLYHDLITIVFLDINSDINEFERFTLEFHKSILLAYAVRGCIQFSIWLTTAEIDVPYA
jgi:hypothetical protein